MSRRLAAAILLVAVMCFADTAGPFSGTGTGAVWTTPTNTATINATYATDNIAFTDISGTLYISSLGFSIPTGSTINGITATYVRKCSATGSCNTDTGLGGYVNLSKATAGTSACTNKGTATTWTTADVTDTWGSASDLWGCGWTVSDINGSNFGLVTVVYNSHGSLSRTASIDYLAITVTYTPPAGGMGRRVIRSQTRSAGARARGGR